MKCTWNHKLNEKEKHFLDEFDVIDINYQRVRITWMGLFMNALEKDGVSRIKFKKSENTDFKSVFNIYVVQLALI